MSETVVAVVAEEIEAEIIRSRLEAEGIPARIAPKSQIGYPGAWSPGGLGYGIGSFSVRVPSGYARTAREIVGDAGEPPRDQEALPRVPKPHAHIVVRLIATVILLYFLIGTAYWLTRMLLPET